MGHRIFQNNLTVLQMYETTSPRGTEKKVLSKVTWEMPEVEKLKAKETSHKQYTLVDEVIPIGVQDNNSDTAVYVHWNSTIMPWIVDDGSQISPIGVGGCRYAKGGGHSDPHGDGLELEASACTCVSHDVDIDDRLD